MSNVKVLPDDPFILNCKMMINDLFQVQSRVNRMWASSRNDADQMLLERMDKYLTEMLDDVRGSLDS